MTERPSVWRDLVRPGPASAVTPGGEIRAGSRVRLAPGRGGDVLDLALAGRTARVEGLDQDQDGALHVSVVLDEDPGRDLGDGRFPGHRFFFALDEVELLEAAPEEPERRLLVAGIGNLFLGDDGFGPAVARRLAGEGAQPAAREADEGRATLPAGVDVADFGIRGMDLVYALNRGYDGVLLIDALPRGEPPGTLTVLEPEVPDGEPVFLDTHGMDPAKVLRFARQLGPVPEATLIVGCEPATAPAGEPCDDDMTMELSAPVRDAVDRAVELVLALAARFIAHGRFEPAGEAPAAGAPEPDDGGDPCASR